MGVKSHQSESRKIIYLLIELYGFSNGTSDISKLRIFALDIFCDWNTLTN